MIHDFSSSVSSSFPLSLTGLDSGTLLTLAKFSESEYSRLALPDSPHATFDRLLEGTSWTWTWIWAWNGQGAAMATGADDVDDAREQARDG